MVEAPVGIEAPVGAYAVGVGIQAQIRMKNLRPNCGYFWPAVLAG